MAKTKISEYDSTAANNTDVDGVNLAEGCPPSGINNAIREVMSHLKNFQDGSSGDSLTNSGTLTSSGTLAVTGGLTLDGSTGTSGQVLVSSGSSATPTWGDAFVTGMIMLWSGSTGTIPSGWALCNGSSGTPDLRDRFVVGAGSTYAVNATGGSKDAVVVSHSHTLSGTTGAGGSHSHKVLANVGVTDTGAFGSSDQVARNSVGGLGNQDYTLCKTTTGATVGNTSTIGTHTHSLSGSTSSVGSSGTNANLPPYYALAYIMKL